MIDVLLPILLTGNMGFMAWVVRELIAVRVTFLNHEERITRLENKRKRILA